MKDWETVIVWEGDAVFVLHDPHMAGVLGPYAVCVKGTTHAVIVGRTADRVRALRVAERLNRYPRNARIFAGMVS